MPVKLKVLIFASRASCLISLIGAATIFGISLYLSLSEERRISVPIIDAWQSMLTKLIILSVFVTILSIFWFWGATKCKKDNTCVIALVLITIVILFVVGLYLTVVSSMYSQQKPLNKDEIFNSTKSTISQGILEHEDPKWVPIWLISIQEESETCCGVRTFKDWDEFWKPIRKHVPKSCCKKPKKCHTDLDSIPYPDTVANNIKVDTGCYADINARIHKLLYQAFVLALILTVYLGVTLFTFLLEYSCAFLRNTTTAADNVDQNNDALFLSDEQTWANLNFFPAQNKDTQVGEAVVVGASSGEIIDENVQTTDSDVAENQITSKPMQETTANYLSQSQQTTEVPLEQLQMNPVPNIDRLPESDTFIEAGVIEGQQQPYNTDLDRITGRNFMRRHHRRHRE